MSPPWAEVVTVSTEDAAAVLLAQGRFWAPLPFVGVGHSDSSTRGVGGPPMFMKLPTADCSLRTPKVDPLGGWLASAAARWPILRVKQWGQG